MHVFWGYARKKIHKPETTWQSGPEDKLPILHGKADLGAIRQANLFLDYP
jgi:hypothetical protein